jgi:hypothetical protein
MRKFLLAAGAVAALFAAPLLPGKAEAAPIGAAGFQSALEDMSILHKAQYVYGGRNYCWYGAGWRGPGWYWCGYAWRRGFGWGGPVGWRGWVYRAPAVVVRPVPRRVVRPRPRVIVRP